jgi:PBSX family phage terminase large subunit
MIVELDINFVEDFGVIEPYRSIKTKYPDKDIYFIWGGRGAAKTYSMPPILLDKALDDDVFKCLVIRKIYATLQESCYSKITGFISDIENSDYIFETKLSPLKIKCQLNGNAFLFRGCDNPESLKSTDDPNVVWWEEADQIPKSAFDIVKTSLRGKGKIQQFLTFNPEVNSEGKSWIYEDYFKPLEEQGVDIYQQFLEFEIEQEVEVLENDVWVTRIVTKHCLSIHTTCHDNPHCPIEQRAEFASYKDFDVNKYNVWYLGRWGRREVSKPFIYQFKETHIGKCKYDPALPVYVSFDFNVDPITAIVCQHDGGANGGVSNCIRVIKEYRIANSDIHDLCERIRADYYGAVIYVTGDASGKNASALVRGKINYYTVIREILAIPVRNIKIPDANPKMAGESGNRVLCNRIFHKHPDLLIDESCKYLIDDIRYVEADASGAVDKKTQGAHLMDTLRYYFNTFHAAWLKIQ